MYVFYNTAKWVVIADIVVVLCIFYCFFKTYYFYVASSIGLGAFIGGGGWRKNCFYHRQLKEVFQSNREK